MMLTSGAAVPATQLARIPGWLESVRRWSEEEGEDEEETVAPPSHGVPRPAATTTASCRVDALSACADPRVATCAVQPEEEGEKGEEAAASHQRLMLAAAAAPSTARHQMLIVARAAALYHIAHDA
jgi:hypothetical protein